MGELLAQAIAEMGLNPTRFAKLCLKKDGKPLSQSAIINLIHKPGVQPKDETVEAVEAVLARRCPHCHQYWEKAGEPAKKKK